MTGHQDDSIGQWSASLAGTWRSFAAAMAEATVTREQKLAQLRDGYLAAVARTWSEFHDLADNVFASHRDLSANQLDQAPPASLAPPAATPPGPTGDSRADLAALSAWAAEHNPAASGKPPEQLPAAFPPGTPSIEQPPPDKPAEQ